MSDILKLRAIFILVRDRIICFILMHRDFFKYKWFECLTIVHEDTAQIKALLRALHENTPLHTKINTETSIVPKATFMHVHQAALWSFECTGEFGVSRFFSKQSKVKRWFARRNDINNSSHQCLIKGLGKRKNGARDRNTSNNKSNISEYIYIYLYICNSFSTRAEKMSLRRNAILYWFNVSLFWIMINYAFATNNIWNFAILLLFFYPFTEPFNLQIHISGFFAFIHYHPLFCIQTQSFAPSSLYVSSIGRRLYRYFYGRYNCYMYVCIRARTHTHTLL